MEKVIILESIDSLSDRKAEQINEWLKKGWKVKSVTTTHTDTYVTAIFVLTDEEIDE